RKIGKQSFPGRSSHLFLGPYFQSNLFMHPFNEQYFYSITGWKKRPVSSRKPGFQIVESAAVAITLDAKHNYLESLSDTRAYTITQGAVNQLYRCHARERLPRSPTLYASGLE